MRLGPHIQALQTELASIAGLGDEAIIDIAERLSQALEANLGQRLLAVLGDAALEVNAQLPAGHVEIRLAGQDPSLLYVQDEATPVRSAEDALAARITLRLPDSLKAAVEKAAAQDRVSVNTWIIGALGRSITSSAVGRVGRRLSGYAEA